MATPIDTQEIANKIAEALASAISSTSEAAQETAVDDNDLELEESSRSSYQKDAESGAI